MAHCTFFGGGVLFPCASMTSLCHTMQWFSLVLSLELNYILFSFFIISPDLGYSSLGSPIFRIMRCPRTCYQLFIALYFVTVISDITIDLHAYLQITVFELLKANTNTTYTTIFYLELKLLLLLNFCSIMACDQLR